MAWAGREGGGPREFREAGKVHLAFALERHSQLGCIGLLHFRTFLFSLQKNRSLHQHFGLLSLPKAGIRKGLRGKRKMGNRRNTFCSRARGSCAILKGLTS